jgi:DNA-binding HxlR family transcriptional regulator
LLELKQMKDRLDPDPEIASPIFIGKWTVKIIYLLKEGPHRHGQLRRRLGKISPRILTRTLRNLESAGLISRQVTQSKSIAVEYSLTTLGRRFVVPLGSICRWADRHGKELSATIHLSKRKLGSRSPTHKFEEAKPSTEQPKKRVTGVA